MDFTTLTIKFLELLANIVGNYGFAIIVLTIIIRLAMWPLNVSQQRSMRMMQNLQPKIKALQDRYKSDPQKMQMKLMEFYKEHKFNPMGGCLPLLVQLPIFILLYSALMSPQFIQIAGDTSFGFLSRLDTTLRATAGRSYDGEFGVSQGDTFTLGKTAKVYLSNETLDNVKIKNPAKAVEIQGEFKPGESIDFKVDLDHLDLKFAQLNDIVKAEIPVTDMSNKEVENVTFEKQGNVLAASFPTVAASRDFHWDVFLLIALFAITMFASQKVMMATQKNKNGAVDPAQEAIQKSMGTFMPIMIIGTFVIIPIPAGVLLYLVTSNVIQIVQTVIVNKQIDLEYAQTGNVTDIDISNAKKIEPKE
ncbi:YidC/Oxa1 family membrane protein insertase [bacterium]|nr:YidC/Oxa1 family membrane protein insertase [bacterium]